MELLTWIALKKSDLVMVDDGPFKGLKGIFQSYAGDERVIVLLNMLSQEARVLASVRSIGQVCVKQNSTPITVRCFRALHSTDTYDTEVTSCQKRA